MSVLVVKGETKGKGWVGELKGQMKDLHGCQVYAELVSAGVEEIMVGAVLEASSLMIEPGFIATKTPLSERIDFVALSFGGDSVVVFLLNVGTFRVP